MGNGNKKPPTQAEIDAAALAAQSAQDTKQDGQISTQMTQVDKIHKTEKTQTQDVLDNSADASSNAAQLGQLQNNVMLQPPQELPGSDAQGILQRLRIYVPSCESVLNLGHSDVRHGTYNGFGLLTEGHAMFSAMGAGVGDSRMVFESQQNMVVQAVKSYMFFGAKEVMALVAGANVLVGSPAGVLLHGGIDAAAASPVDDHRTTDTPKEAEEYYDAYKAVKKKKAFWEYVDAAFNGFELAKYAIERKVDSHHKKFVLINPGTVAAAGAVAGVIGGAYGYTGTVVHGESGLVVGSKTFTSLHGGLVLVNASVGGVFLGTIGRYELHGGEASEVVSMAGHVTANSRDRLEAIGAKELKISARTKHCQIDGATVSIGGFGAPAPQGASESVTIAAQHIAALHGKKMLFHGKNVAALEGKTIAIAGKTHVAIGSGDHVALAVGKTHLYLENNCVQIGLFSDKAADPPTRAKFPGKGHHYPNEAAGEVEKRAKKSKEYADNYLPPGESGSFIIMTNTKIKVKCGNKKVLRVTSGGWKYPNMDVM